jgi:hypothetical protein
MNTADRQEQRKTRKAASRADAQRQRDAIQNPKYWAASVEAKVNGILQQVSQQFEEGHPLRVMLTRHCDELGAYIHDGSVAYVPDEPAEGLVDARLVLVPQEQSA